MPSFDDKNWLEYRAIEARGFMAKRIAWRQAFRHEILYGNGIFMSYANQQGKILLRFVSFIDLGKQHEPIFRRQTDAMVFKG